MNRLVVVHVPLCIEMILIDYYQGFPLDFSISEFLKLLQNLVYYIYIVQGILLQIARTEFSIL